MATTDPLELCTVDDVLIHPALAGRREAKIEDTHLTDWIARAIKAFSASVERICDRPLRLMARTEILDVARWSYIVTLRAYPITEVQEVRESTTQEFDSSAILDASDYALSQQGRTGTLHFMAARIGGPQSLRVIYTGGIAADLQHVPDDLRDAAATHVAYLVMRAPTLQLESMGVMQGSATMFSKASMLPAVKEVLDGYTRMI
jgi:hypothetical protein